MTLNGSNKIRQSNCKSKHLGPKEILIQGPSDALKQGEPVPSTTTFFKLTAHLILLQNPFVWCLCIFVVLGLPFLCLAQELEPRRWSHLPIGTNFAGGGYAYTEADIFLDPVLRTENVKMEMHSWAVKYIRSFELFQKSARIGFIQGYQEGRWTGEESGQWN